MHRITHTFSQSDIFQSYDLETFKFKQDVGTAKELKKKYKCGTKQILVARVFWSFIKLVIRDLIEKGITFHFPTKDISILTWQKLEGEEFVKAYQSGKFDDTDFLITNFSLFLPIFKYFYCGQFKTKSVRFGKADKKKLIDKINLGFRYC